MKIESVTMMGVTRQDIKNLHEKPTEEQVEKSIAMMREVEVLSVEKLMRGRGWSDGAYIVAAGILTTLSVARAYKIKELQSAAERAIVAMARVPMDGRDNPLSYSLTMDADTKAFIEREMKLVAELA